MPGKLYGLGLGPGDPELVTVKASRILGRVPVVAVPKAATSRPSLALEVAAPYLCPSQEVLELALPMTRDQNRLQEAWAGSGREVARRLEQGLDVAYLTLGDPFTYSTYAYLLEYLRQLLPGLEVENVPGVTSFAAAASAATWPLVEGDETLAVVPGTIAVSEMASWLDSFSTVVILKAAGHYREWVELLRRKGLEQEAVLVSRCGFPDEVCTRDLDAWVDREISYFSLIMARGAKKK